MRKTALAVAAALVVVAAPVTAQEAEIVPTEPCAASEEFAPLGISGTSEEVSPSLVPSVGTDFDDVAGEELVGYHEQSVAAFQYRLDLSGSPTVPDAATGNVTLTLNWDNDGDYDLYVYDAEGNSIGEGANGFNPLNGAGETMQISRAAHCTDFRVEIVNYLAPGGPLTAMDLTAKVTSLKP